MLKYFYITLNPENWAVGPAATARQGGRWIPYIAPNKQLEAYKESVREAIVPQLEPNFRPLDVEVGLSFFLWRRLDEYKTGSGRNSSRHYADTTNMQKALEDALQGPVLRNDKQVRKVMSETVEQTRETWPGAIIVLTTDWKKIPTELSPAMLDSFAADRRRVHGPIQLDNDW